MSVLMPPSSSFMSATMLRSVFAAPPLEPHRDLTACERQETVLGKLCSRMGVFAQTGTESFLLGSVPAARPGVLVTAQPHHPVGAAQDSAFFCSPNHNS